MENGGGFPRFKWITLVVSGLLQVSNYSGSFIMENGGGYPCRKTVVSFIWRTTAMSYRPRAAVVGFKWSTLVVVGFNQRTTVVSFREEQQQFAINGELK